MAPVVADASALLALARLNRLAAGILVMAKRAGMIPSVREALDLLRQAGFRLRQDVYEQIVADAGENLPG